MYRLKLVNSGFKGFWEVYSETVVSFPRLCWYLQTLPNYIWHCKDKLHAVSFMGPHPAFCHLPYHTANDKSLSCNEARLCASFAHKVMGFVEPSLTYCFLTFCSLSRNQISAEGTHALAKALHVNRSLQELKWVQPFMSYLLKGVHWYCIVSF